MSFSYKRDIPQISSKNVPYLTTEQMVKVDKAMIEDCHIELVQMMENAGHNLAHLARTRFFDGNAAGKKVIVLVGTGCNGGGAMVSARRLHCWGASVQVLLTKSDEFYSGISLRQLDTLKHTGVNVSHSKDLENAKSVDLIIDGIIGYSLRGNPRGGAADVIHFANTMSAPVLALDTPSGVDTSSGIVFYPVISATATLALALPKEGLRNSKALKHVGELYLADIGVPPDLYSKILNIQVSNLFSKNDIIRLC